MIDHLITDFIDHRSDYQNDITRAGAVSSGTHGQGQQAFSHHEVSHDADRHTEGLSDTHAGESGPVYNEDRAHPAKDKPG